MIDVCKKPESEVNRSRCWMVASLGILFVTYPIMIWGTVRVVETNRNNIPDWSAPGSPAREDFDEFRRWFGENDVVFVSWPGCRLDDPRLIALTRELDSPQYKKYFQRVLSGRSAVDVLTDQVGLTYDRSRSRLRGVFLGSDLESTGVSLSLTAAGSLDREDAFHQLASALSDAGVPLDETRIAGPAHDIHSVDEEDFGRLCALCRLSCYCRSR